MKWLYTWCVCSQHRLNNIKKRCLNFSLKSSRISQNTNRSDPGKSGPLAQNCSWTKKSRSNGKNLDTGAPVNCRLNQVSKTANADLMPSFHFWTGSTIRPGYSQTALARL